MKTKSIPRDQNYDTNCPQPVKAKITRLEHAIMYYTRCWVENADQATTAGALEQVQKSRYDLEMTALTIMYNERKAAKEDSAPELPEAAHELFVDTLRLFEAAKELALDSKIMATCANDAAKTDRRWEGFYEKMLPRIKAVEDALAKIRGEGR